MTKAKKKRAVRTAKKQTPSMAVVLSVLGVAVLVVIGLVYLTGQAGSKPAQIPTTSERGYEIGITPEGFPYKGRADAPVGFEIYSDYRCGYCAQFALETEPLIEQAYVASGQVKLVAHYFGFNAETQTLATAALCAAEQGKFWEFNQAMFINQSSLTVSLTSALAQQLGLDTNVFNSCAQSSTNKAKVERYTNQAMAAGVSSTPTFYINGKQIVGAQPFEQFQAEIERALAVVQ